MPFGKYDAPKPEPVPTFLQFVKSAPKGVEGKTRFQVDIIWLPGKFDNITLQTHKFRYVATPDHPLYAEILEYLPNQVLKGASPRLNIVIDSIQGRTIDLTEDDKVKGCWEKLGSNAFKYKNP